MGDGLKTRAAQPAVTLIEGAKIGGSGGLKSRAAQPTSTLIEGLCVGLMTRTTQPTTPSIEKRKC